MLHMKIAAPSLLLLLSCHSCSCSCSSLSLFFSSVIQIYKVIAHHKATDQQLIGCICLQYHHYDRATQGQYCFFGKEGGINALYHLNPVYLLPVRSYNFVSELIQLNEDLIEKLCLCNIFLLCILFPILYALSYSTIPHHHTNLPSYLFSNNTGWLRVVNVLAMP